MITTTMAPLIHVNYVGFINCPNGNNAIWIVFVTVLNLYYGCHHVYC